MADILIIDDDIAVCKALEKVMGTMGHRSRCAHTLREGIDKAVSNQYDVVFLDVRLPDGNGLDQLAGIRSAKSSPEVIIITGEGDPDGAELAMESGVWDYIEKPLSIESMTLPLIRALQYRDEKKTPKLSVALNRAGIIGESRQINNCLNFVAQSAESDVNVLITGETGTGKERFASAIHENSNRQKGNFVIVDCASLPETLVESVLFGHVKGAFTGADKYQEGLIKQADGGTIFLDEVGELPLSIQKAFLRVLQEHRFRPVGGKAETTSDFRLIAATNRDLDQMINAGKFRKDLKFRIESLVIELPPLKERVKDIKELAIHFMTKFCERQGIGTKGFSPEFIETLEAYCWPGNVRELINALEGAISKVRHEPTLFPKHLPNSVRINVARSLIGSSNLKRDNAEQDDPVLTITLPTMKEFRETVVADNEKKYLLELMSLTNGDIQQACQVSGLGRARLYGLIKTYGISRAV